jgi:hypothetical protein
VDIPRMARDYNPRRDHIEPSDEALRLADDLAQAASDIQNGACVACVVSWVRFGIGLPIFGLLRHNCNEF